MSKQGYVKLHRKIQDCWVWNDKPFNQGAAWMDMILLANHADVKINFEGKPTCIKRGTFITSNRVLAESWGWSKDAVNRFLKTLEADNMIFRECDSRKTLITIVNYSVYQYFENESCDSDDTVTIQSQDSHDTQVIQSRYINNNDKNNKNIKNDKNEKKNRGDFFPLDKNLDEAFFNFYEMRKKIKKPMTAHAVDLAINKLNKLSKGNNELAILILDQSILNNWQDLYEIKRQNNTKPSGNSQLDSIFNTV